MLGFRRDELSLILDHTLKGLQLESVSSLSLIHFPSELKQCRISSLSITGLFAMDCSYSSFESTLGEDDTIILFQDLDRFCQMNETMLSTVLLLIPQCTELEEIRLNDHGFNAHQVIDILSTLLSAIDKLPKLKEVHLLGSFIDKESSNFIRSLVSRLERHEVTIYGIALFEGSLKSFR